jgi:hypothetical protein
VLGIVGAQLGFTALVSSIMAQPGLVYGIALNPSLAWLFIVFLLGLGATVASVPLQPSR